MTTFENTRSTTTDLTLAELISLYNAKYAEVESLTRTCKDWRDYQRAVDEANALWQKILDNY